MHILSTCAFRKTISETINVTAYSGEPTMLMRRGKKVAVLVSLKDYEELLDYRLMRDSVVDNTTTLTRGVINND